MEVVFSYELNREPAPFQPYRPLIELCPIVEHFGIKHTASEKQRASTSGSGVLLATVKFQFEPKTNKTGRGAGSCRLGRDATVLRGAPEQSYRRSPAKAAFPWPELGRFAGLHIAGRGRGDRRNGACGFAGLRRAVSQLVEAAARLNGASIRCHLCGSSAIASKEVIRRNIRSARCMLARIKQKPPPDFSSGGSVTYLHPALLRAAAQVGFAAGAAVAAIGRLRSRSHRSHQRE